MPNHYPGFLFFCFYSMASERVNFLIGLTKTLCPFIEFILFNPFQLSLKMTSFGIFLRFEFIVSMYHMNKPVTQQNTRV